MSEHYKTVGDFSRLRHMGGEPPTPLVNSSSTHDAISMEEAIKRAGQLVGAGEEVGQHLWNAHRHGNLIEVLRSYKVPAEKRGEFIQLFKQAEQDLKTQDGRTIKERLGQQEGIHAGAESFPGPWD